MSGQEDFSRTQEFRDTMMRFVGETTTSLNYLRDGMDELRKNGCAKGIDDRARIKALEVAVRSPVRKAALVGTGVAAAVGTAVAVAKEIWEAVTK